MQHIQIQILFIAGKLERFFLVLLLSVCGVQDDGMEESCHYYLKYSE